MNPGDLVQLKSGGPSMTVIKLVEKEIKCMWFESGVVLRSESFPEAALVSAEPLARSEAKVYDPDAVGAGDMGEILAHSMETQKKVAVKRAEEDKPLLRDD
jgi:uncharacterized protein YodC (DUF2158 family)